MSAVARVLASLMLLILALVVTFFLWLVFTSSGLAFTLNQVPGLVIKGEVKGRLFDRVELAGLHYGSQGVELSAKQLSLDWQPFALFGRELKVRKLTLSGVNGRSESSSDTASDAPLELDLPFNLSVDDFQLRTLSWSHDKAKPIDLDLIDFSGGLRESRLSIKRLEVVRAEEFVSINGEADISIDKDETLELEFAHGLNSSLGLTETWVGSGTVSGSWGAFEFKHRSDAPYQSESVVGIENLLDESRNWRLNSKLVDVVLANEQGVELAVSGEIRSKGSVASNSTQSKLHVRSQAQQYGINLDTSVEHNRLHLNQFDISEIRAEVTPPPSVSFVGELGNFQSLFADTGETPDVSLSGEWSNLDFLSELMSSELPASRGQLSLDGNFDNYELKAQAEIQNPQFKQVNVTLTGHGNTHSFNTRQLTVAGDGLRLNSTAQLGFLDQDINLTLSGIQGELRGQAISGSLKLGLTGSDMEVDRLKLEVGGAKLSGHGLLGEVSDFEWSLDVPDFSLISADSRGSISTNGTVKGQLGRPVVAADIVATSLSYQRMSLASAKGKLTFGFAKQSAWDGELKLDQLRLDQRGWLDHATVSLSGSLEQHRVKLVAGFSGKEDALLDWRGGYIDQALSFSGRLDELPADVIQPISNSLPFEVSGSLGIEFNGSYDFVRLLTLESSSMANDLVFKSKAENETDVLLNDFKLELSAGESVELVLLAQLEDGSKVTGQASVVEPLLSEQFLDSGLKGRFDIDYPNLRSLQAILPASVNAEGKLTANAKLSGIVRAPEVLLNASISEGLLGLPEQGIDLQQASIDISSSSINRFQVTGTARAGQGSITLDGNIDISNHQLPSSELNLVANDALFINTPEINAQGDADVRLNLVDNRLDISGTLNVKEADIMVASTVSAVGESPDLVLLGVEPKKNALGVTMNLALDLGDNSLISAGGLTGRLVGRPSIKLDEKGLLTSIGEVKVVDGWFSIVGQKLKIDKGVASYAGGAIDNPWLSFEASKTIGSTRAGIAIQGNADSPELNLFSEPDYEDQDILSLVFFEKRLDQLSSIDGFKLVRIANALRGGNSASRVDAITDNIADYLGVDKLDVSFDSSNDERSLSLSSKINSKLDIGYAYNFISSLQALFLRYKINQNWSIQSSVDVESGADVLYKIEYD